MISRPLMLAGVLGAAAGGPYLVSQAPDDWSQGWGTSQPADTQPVDPLAQLNLNAPQVAGLHGPGSPAYTSPAPLGGPVGLPLEQALDWNVTRNWVYQHWARKSTGLSDPSLFGVRVPLVTGSAMTDLAGSLTYYFDHSGVLQRMRLTGRTADTSRIAQVAMQRFGMQPRRAGSPGDQLFQAVEQERVRAELRTRPDAVMWSTAPHDSFLVEFEANRPGGTRWVEPPKLDLELPPAVAPPAATETASTAAGEVDPSTGRPILPPRSLVPDRGPVTATSGSSVAAPSVDGAVSAPKAPAIGAPVQAAPGDIRPLDGHKDRFRWPG